jgi:hypothetical protein
MSICERKVTLTLKNSGQVVLISELDRVLDDGQWHLTRRGYVKRYSPKLQQLHRVIMERMIGRPLSPREYVDHRSTDKLDNTRGNLRLASHTQSERNKGLRRDSTSGYKGVSRILVSGVWKGKWKATITIQGKAKHLGSFSSEVEAAKAYDRAAVEIFGEFALLNFPKPVRVA